MNRRLRRLIAAVVDGGGGWIPSWLFLEKFDTDDNAPLTNPLPLSPGPGGNWTPTNTNNALAISSGNLTVAGTTNAGGDGIIAASGLSRAEGLTVMQGFSAFTYGIVYPFVSAGSSLATTGLGTFPSSSASLLYSRVAYIISISNNLPQAGDTYAVVVFSTGSAILRYRSSAWLLLFVERASAGAALYPQINNATVGGGLSNYSLSGYGAAVLDNVTRTNFVTDSTDSASANATITHTADGVLEATHQFVGGETYEISFRRTDDNNRWLLRVVLNTDTATLVKVESGVETVVATNATKNFSTTGTTWFYIRMTGQTVLCGFAGSADGGDLFNYTTAAFNITETGAKVNLASTYFYSYAETVPAAIVSKLETMRQTINP